MISHLGSGHITFFISLTTKGKVSTEGNKAYRGVTSRDYMVLGGLGTSLAPPTLKNMSGVTLYKTLALWNLHTRNIFTSPTLSMYRNDRK